MEKDTSQTAAAIQRRLELILSSIQLKLNLTLNRDLKKLNNDLNNFNNFNNKILKTPPFLASICLPTNQEQQPANAQEEQEPSKNDEHDQSDELIIITEQPHSSTNQPIQTSSDLTQHTVLPEPNPQPKPLSQIPVLPAPPQAARTDPVTCTTGGRKKGKKKRKTNNKGGGREGEGRMEKMMRGPGREFGGGERYEPATMEGGEQGRIQEPGRPGMMMMGELIRWGPCNQSSIPGSARGPVHPPLQAGGPLVPDQPGVARPLPPGYCRPYNNYELRQDPPAACNASYPGYLPTPYPAHAHYPYPQYPPPPPFVAPFEHPT